MKGLKGEFVIELVNNIGNITFQLEKILQASSPHSRAIEDILVDQGFITMEKLLETIKSRNRWD
jgi:hypothetical protein